MEYLFKCLKLFRNKYIILLLILFIYIVYKLNITSNGSDNPDIKLPFSENNESEPKAAGEAKINDALIRSEKIVLADFRSQVESATSKVINVTESQVIIKEMQDVGVTHNVTKTTSGKFTLKYDQKLRIENKNKSTELEFKRRKQRIAEVCKKLQIIKDDIARQDWNGAECNHISFQSGYNECISPHHFPLARSASSMTCLINKVASTSVALLFLFNDGRETPSLESVASSPHAFVTTIAAERKEEFIFAMNHFFKFLIVRDPFERLLSAYLDKVVKANHWSLLDLRADIMNYIIEHKGYLTNTYVQIDEKLVKEYEEKRRTVENTVHDRKNQSYVPSFQEFLEYILSSNLEGEGFASHWVPYWKWCAPCSINYDIIVKLDSSPSDLEYIWTRMGIQDRKKIPWVNRNFEKIQEFEAMVKFHYSKLTLKIIAEVYRKFYFDFMLFEYDIVEVLKKGQHCSNEDCEHILKKYFET